MLGGVFRALNSLPIHVIFTKIAPGVYPEGAKKGDFGITGRITGKWLQLKEWMLQGVLEH